MKSVLIREQKRYSIVELTERFKCTEPKIKPILRKLKEYGVLKTVKADKDKKDLSDDISANATAIEDLDKIVKDGSKGNEALKDAIDDINDIVTDASKGNAALKTAIEGVDSALETLGKAVVKTVKIGDTALTTTNNTC